VLRGATATILATGLAVAPLVAGDARAVATAIDDPFYTVNEDEVLLVDAPGVLANDTDSLGGPICVVEVDDSGLEGTLEWDSDGSFTYTPDADWNGVTTFTYGARASDADCAGDPEGPVATVTITVNAVNDSPTAKADSFQALRDRTLNVSAPGVLRNDGDVDGDGLTAQKVSDPAHGIVNLAPDGGFSYTPAAGYVGPDAFSYRASDGTDTSPARGVSITVTALPTAPPNVAPTPPPTAPPSVAPASSPTPSPEASESPAPDVSASPGASVAVSPSPSASLGPADPAAGEGGLSIPILVGGLLLASLLAFGGAVFVPKWLQQRRAADDLPPEDGEGFGG